MSILIEIIDKCIQKIINKQKAIKSIIWLIRKIKLIQMQMQNKIWIMFLMDIKIKIHLTKITKTPIQQQHQILLILITIIKIFQH